MKNAWGIVFKVIDGDIESSSFQDMYEFNKTEFGMITNEKEVHPCYDNVSISIR